jgi:arsenite oxidase small subunit
MNDGERHEAAAGAARAGGMMPTRRGFLKVGGSGVAGLVAGPSLSAAAKAADDPSYPVVAIAALKDIGKGAAIAFSYPDARSPAVLLRLAEPAAGGVGPNRNLVAYSTLCTHKGCTVRFQAERKALICPCHWSVFDPAKAGALVIGQASQSLPRIELRVATGVVHAVGVTGLIYGRHTNIV